MKNFIKIFRPKEFDIITFLSVCDVRVNEERI